MEEIYSYTAEITQKAIETQEEFIFQTIAPFCEEIMEQHISKEYLVNALLKYRRLEAENEKLRAQLAQINKLSKIIV